MSQDLGLREVGENNFDFQDVDLDPIQDESDENESEEALEDNEKPKEEEVFEVETILDRKLASNGELLYYVKWLGYSDESENTWEPEENLEECREKILQYNRSNPEKKVKKKIVKSANEDQDFSPEKQDVEAKRQHALKMQRIRMQRIRGSGGPEKQEEARLHALKLQRIRMQRIRVPGGTSGQVRVRRNVGVYACGECGKIASTPNGLRVHRSQNNHYADLHIGMKTNLLKTETENLLCNFRAENAKYRLQFTSFEGTRCELKCRAVGSGRGGGSGSRGDRMYAYSNVSFPYRIIEVMNEMDPRWLKGETRAENKAPETLLILIPESFIETMPAKLTDFSVPYEVLDTELYMAEFPWKGQRLCTREEKQETSVVKVNRLMGNMLRISEIVGNEEIFLVTKSRFKYMKDGESINVEVVEQAEGGEEETNSLKRKKRIMDITRAPSVKKVKKNDSANFNIADIMACHGISMPTCACPYENCDFVSKNMFIGVRIHLVKHFTKEIRAVAMPKMKTNPMANFQAKDNSFQCMSGWNCSIPNLESRGELVSHYGLLHCYVDLFFRQYLELWLSTLPPSCPFDSYQYVDVVDYIRHLTDSHFYTAIEVEVGEMVHWKAGLAEYKCPYCVMKFPVRTLEGGERDLGDLVEHCGLLHNFSLYYLQQGYPPAGVKQEMGLKQEEEELEPLLNIPVKTELLEEGEPIVFQENPVKLEPETSCIDVKEEPVEAGDDIAATEAPVLADIRDLSKLTVEELEQVYRGLGQGTPLGGRGAMVSLLEKSRNPAYRLDVEGWNRRFMEKKRQILEKKQQQQQQTQSKEKLSAEQMVARAARHRETAAPDWLAMRCDKCQRMFSDVLKYRAHTESGRCGEGGGGEEHEGRANTSHATSGSWCDKCQMMFEDVLQFKAHKGLGTCEGTMGERNGWKKISSLALDEGGEKDEETIQEDDPMAKYDLLKNNKPKSALECQVCLKMFSEHSNMRRHMKNVHEARQYKCHHCDNVYSDSCNMRRHMASVHDGKRVCCNLCDFTTAQKGNLKRHIIDVHGMEDDES